MTVSIDKRDCPLCGAAAARATAHASVCPNLALTLPEGAVQ
jgi:hypothetical protein